MCQLGGSSYEVGYIYNQKIIGSSHNIHAIISPVGISYQDSHYCGSWGSQLHMTVLSSSSSMHSIFQNYESKSVGMKLPAVYRLDGSMFSDSQKSGIWHCNHILGMA